MKCPNAIFFATVLIFALGCNGPNKDTIAGYYCRTNNSLIDCITLNTDYTFQQTITSTNNQTWSAQGKWEFRGSVIELDKCYLSYDDEKQSNIVPPTVVYTCNFSFTRDYDLERSVMQPHWKKTSAQK
jgi:hypothetical protein